MHHREYDDFVLVDTEEDRIREPANQRPSDLAVNDGKLQWVLLDASQLSFELLE